MRVVRRVFGWLLLAVAVPYFWLGMLAWALREWETSNGICYAWERAILTEPLPAELVAIPQGAWVSPGPLVLSIKVYGREEWWRIPLARGITPDYPQKTASPPAVVSDELTVRFTTADGTKVDLTPERVHVSGMNWDSPSAEEVMLLLSRPSTL